LIRKIRGVISVNKTQDLYLKAKKIIPGGTQLLSKRPEQFAPDQWPAYFSKAKGCETWDLDGKHYYDMATNGISACLLGFADETVSEAVINRVKNGCHSSLNPPEEVALAERLIDIHPWAENVRFARTGGEIAAVAVRIARATTAEKSLLFADTMDGAIGIWQRT
jgi:glutamate-1-semialdehyde 2,1-aminomutase